jgi:hypothetical protein
VAGCAAAQALRGVQDDSVDGQEDRGWDRSAKHRAERVLHEQTGNSHWDHPKMIIHARGSSGVSTRRWRTEEAKLVTRRRQSRQKYTSRATAVATRSPTTNARYGDSGADTLRPAAQRPPTRGENHAVAEAGHREQCGHACRALMRIASMELRWVLVRPRPSRRRVSRGQDGRAGGFGFPVLLVLASIRGPDRSAMPGNGVVT